MMKIAIPTQDGKLCQHFGRCPQFTVFTVEGGQVLGSEVLTAPEHAHGSHPNFLRGIGCQEVICGGIGDHAIGMLRDMAIEVHAGAPSLDVADVVVQHLAGTLVYGDGRCAHDGCGGHGHDHHHDQSAMQFKLDVEALSPKA